MPAAPHHHQNGVHSASKPGVIVAPQSLLPGLGRTLLLCVVLCSLTSVGLGRRTELEEPVADSLKRLQRSFAQQLDGLADWCEERGLADQATQTRAWRLPQFVDRHVVYKIPLSTDAADVEEDASDTTSADFTAWRTRFVELRQRQAESLFALLPMAAEQQQVTVAFELVYATLRENPDHEAARQLLGHQQHNGQWHTAATVSRLQDDEVWHDRFGWLKADHVERYEQGERYHRRRWLSAERDAKQHDKIARGWRVETDHFEVTTNHSLEAGVALAGQLEQLHNAWYQLFAAYHTTAADLKKLVRTGKPSRRKSNRHKVVYFRSREEYVRHLAKKQPGIERSIGIYQSDDRTAYFFTGKDQDPGTVLHEATHQLFQEGSAAKRKVAQEANVWIVEGIACYMESLRAGVSDAGSGYDTVGGYDIARLPGARIRLLDDQFYIPFMALTRLGGPMLRRHPQAATIYTQAAGQATFLMHYNNGRYREPVVEYLRAIYSGRARPDTLSQLTGHDFQSLDREYRQFLIGAESTSNTSATSHSDPTDR